MLNASFWPRVALIILNWNNAPDTLACLESVLQSDYPNYHILIVDNGSTDDSAAQIRAAYPDIALLETGANLGYAGGNNVGIRRALTRDAEHVCILNNDVIVAPGFLRPLVDICAQSKGQAVATPMICEYARRDVIWALGASVDQRSGETSRLHAGEAVQRWQGQPPFEVGFAPGTAMLIPRQVLERVGLLDEAFFLYYEEADWCLQARRAGYRMMAAPASVVWHKVSATLGETSPLVDYYMLRNHLCFISRNWSGAARVWLLGRAALRGLATIAAFTAKPHGGKRLPNRNARLLALRDAALGRWGKMGDDVAAACYSKKSS